MEMDLYLFPNHQAISFININATNGTANATAEEIKINSSPILYAKARSQDSDKA